MLAAIRTEYRVHRMWPLEVATTCLPVSSACAVDLVADRPMLAAYLHDFMARPPNPCPLPQ